MIHESTSESGADMFVVDSPYEVANWRPLLHWLMFIPHAVILGALRSVAGIVFVIYWVALLITGRLHPGMYGFLTMYERYNQRADAFLVGLTETYAPFDFSTGAADNGAHQDVTLNFPELPEETPRTAAFNIVLAIPHYIVAAIIAIGVVVVAIVGWFAVLFTGSWPRGMRDFLVRFTNYYLRIWAYVTMVHTEYPKFGLSST